MTSVPRRFAIVAPNLYPRICGVGDHSLRLGQEFRSRGHEVMLFSRAPAEPHPEAPELPVIGATAALPTLLARSLASAIERFRPTEVVLQYTSQMWDAWRFGSPATTLLLRRLRATGARLTVIAHELSVPWRPRPDMFLAALLQRVQLAAMVRQCERLFVTTGTRAALIAPLCRLAGAPGPQVIRIGSNALPIKRRIRDTALASRAPRIGLFSTAAIGKRYDVVLEAFARIAAELPQAELILMGDLGPAEQAGVRAILDAVAQHPARSQIRLTGRLTLAEVARETAELDLYLFPMESGANTRSGTLPLALGSGVPTVAISSFETDRDLFRDGDNLAFAEAMTGAAFAEVALRLLRDPTMAARIGEGGRRLYEDHLSWERICDQLLAD
jgi:glycosyltransferase involved in cell wall biosynthesis